MLPSWEQRLLRAAAACGLPTVLGIAPRGGTADAERVAEAAIDLESAVAAAAAGAEVAATPARAAALLDCEGLGEEHVFWPEFRKALRSQGPLGSDVLRLAYGRWKAWEDFVDTMERAGYFRGNYRRAPSEKGPKIGYGFENGTIVFEGVYDRLDLVKLLQQAHFGVLFEEPHPWGKNDLMGFLACPVGFVLLQYVIFVVHKVRSNLDEVGRMINWESMLNTFGLLLGVPSYALDHLESGSWGITSFDIAVNLRPEHGDIWPSYAEYSRLHPVPPPILSRWWEDAPVLAWARTADADLALGARAGDCRFRVALLGEHGATNMDHLSTVSEALRISCGGDTRQSVTVEAAHFFTYLWNLQGTDEGGALRAALRISWEAFWGEPLTQSQGRSVTASPQWSVARAIQALRGWASREPFLRAADMLVCCEPLWLCVLLHAARGGSRLLVRASMCLLHAFEHVFGAEELPAFWTIVRTFGADVGSRGALSAAARITAEMLDFQTGIRAPYVPALSLHVAAVASYAPATADVLLFRSSLPGSPAFRRVLRLLAAEMGPTAPRIVDMSLEGNMGYKEIASHRAVIILPHVPHALRLSDVYAMGSPVLVPGEPLLHKFVWPFAGPFCGRTDSELAREVDSAAPNRSSPPYSPFDFQRKQYDCADFHDDRRYWLQFTDWELYPHLLRFRSARHLLESAAFSEAEALEVSARVRLAHAALAREALQYWRAAVVAALASEPVESGAS